MTLSENDNQKDTTHTPGIHHTPAAREALRRSITTSGWFTVLIQHGLDTAGLIIPPSDTVE